MYTYIGIIKKFFFFGWFIPLSSSPQITVDAKREEIENCNKKIRNQQRVGENDDDVDEKNNKGK